MDRLPRRTWLTSMAALPVDPPPPAGGAPAPDPTGSLPPLPAPGAPAPPPAPPAPAPPPVVDDVERESSTDQAPVRRLTQTRLGNMLAREKAEGGRAVARERFGVDKLEDLDALVAAGRAAQRAALPADQQAQAELAEERRLRRVAEERTAAVQDDARISDVLQRAGCTLPSAAIAELRGSEGVAVGADAYSIQAAVDRLKVRAPALFAPAVPPPPAAAAAAVPPAGQPGHVPPAGTAPAPAGDPGAPPAAAPPAPTTGFGSRGRAEAERRGHLKPPAAPAAT